MADIPQPLKISDAESAYKAILEMVLQYPSFPRGFTADNTTVRWNMTSKTTSIGLFPLQGAVYLRKYINGSYTAALPFEIIYKTSTTTNKATIEVQDFLADLGRWMESCDIEFSNGITFDSISRTTPVFIAAQDEKQTEYAVNLQLNYSFIK